MKTNQMAEVIDSNTFKSIFKSLCAVVPVSLFPGDRPGDHDHLLLIPIYDLAYVWLTFQARSSRERQTF